MDLMLGLPNQTTITLENCINEISKLNPDHISIYSLILEEGTKLNEKIKNNELELPSEETERKMYWIVKEKLENLGYIHYEISNFSKPGYESKHNMACWNQEEYLGFGLAAHSYLNSTRFSNDESIERYILDFKNKKINETQNHEMKKKEYMLLGLRKIEGIKISEFKKKFIDNPIYIYRESLSKLVTEGLIEIDTDTIKLTNRGIDLANLVWEEFV